MLRLIDRFAEVLAGVAVLSYFAAALVTVGDVIGRRLGAPITGVVDLVQLFVLAGAWLSIPWGFAAGAHVGVDFLLDRMPDRAMRACRIIAGLAAAGLMGLILWKCLGTWRMQAMLGDKSQQLGIPISWFWLPLLAGAAASVLTALAVVIRLASGRAITTQAAH